MKKFILGTLLYVLALGSASAAGVVLNWNANTEADVAGYVVYCGSTETPESMTQLAVVNGVGTTSWADPAFFDGKPADTMYYCALKAFNTSDQFSAFSNVSNGVSVRPPAPEPTPPAAPTGLTLTVTNESR